MLWVSRAAAASRVKLVEPTLSGLCNRVRLNASFIKGFSGVAFHIDSKHSSAFEINQSGTALTRADIDLSFGGFSARTWI